MLSQLIVFIPLALLVALAPGPDNLVVLALGVSRGRAASLGFGLGCAVGCVNHTLLAALGVSALIAASPLAFTLMQYAGAAYLLWLGVRGLWQGGSLELHATEQDVAAPDDFARYFRRGLFANAINPKVALFFLAFLPQFVRPGPNPAWLQLSLFGLCFGVCAALVFGSLAMMAARVGGLLRRRPRLATWLERATGTLFIALGLRLALGETPQLR